MIEIVLNEFIIYYHMNTVLLYNNFNQ